ncbi:hypothetical protein HPP92_013064 [Vanilla planifolia]|uniref:Uncharacterized protein n=1 Tax=Vanilla planifolia TaxID=51239 RepID=A0A835UZN1_VANPL|nr:hypothetical protein HPP92_013064 [Vanilla planifolia]
MAGKRARKRSTTSRPKGAPPQPTVSVRIDPSDWPLRTSTYSHNYWRRDWNVLYAVSLHRPNIPDKSNRSMSTVVPKATT